MVKLFGKITLFDVVVISAIYFTLLTIKRGEIIATSFTFLIALVLGWGIVYPIGLFLVRQLNVRFEEKERQRLGESKENVV